MYDYPYSVYRMKTIIWIWAAILALIILGGGWFYLREQQAAAPAPQAPSASIGIHLPAQAGGSVNQGNLGVPDSGTPQ